MPQIPAYVEVHKEGEGTVFVHVQEALDDAEIGTQVNDYAIAQLEEWSRRWGVLLPILHANHANSNTAIGAELAESIEQVKKRHKESWPLT